MIRKMPAYINLKKKDCQRCASTAEPARSAETEALYSNFAGVVFVGSPDRLLRNHSNGA